MADLFRKSVTTVPGALINVTRRGLSTTIRAVEGNYAGAGLSRRSNLDGYGAGNGKDGPLPSAPYLIPGTQIRFGSSDVSQMTSPGLESFKELLLATRQRKREIETEIRKAQFELGWAHAKRVIGWASLTAAVPAIRRNLANGIADKRADIATLRNNLANTKVAVDFNMETEIAGPHQTMLDAFEVMRTSLGVWSVATEQKIDRVRARSSAGTVVQRKPVALSRRGVSLVETTNTPLALGTLGGFAPPIFIQVFVLVDGPHDFALVDMKELAVDCTAVDFSESDQPPADGQLVGETWAKANKNGSRDRRFTHNRKIPILRYGEIWIRSPNGLNEAYPISRSQACGVFTRAFNELRILLSSQAPTRVQKGFALPRKS